MDMQYLKQKQDLGAQYAVTQLFFDNEKYYAFVEKVRQMGITIPIILWHQAHGKIESANSYAQNIPLRHP